MFFLVQKTPVSYPFFNTHSQTSFVSRVVQQRAFVMSLFLLVSVAPTRCDSRLFAHSIRCHLGHISLLSLFRMIHSSFGGLRMPRLASRCAGYFNVLVRVLFSFDFVMFVLVGKHG